MFARAICAGFQTCSGMCRGMYLRKFGRRYLRVDLLYFQRYMLQERLYELFPGSRVQGSLKHRLVVGASSLALYSLQQQ